MQLPTLTLAKLSAGGRRGEPAALERPDESCGDHERHHELHAMFAKKSPGSRLAAEDGSVGRHAGGISRNCWRMLR